jgi:pimeloyl-ACP methyl ester carboxylesterase
MASVAPGLPSCGEGGSAAGAGGPGLSEDVAVTRQVLLASDEPTVVVAHSYGGIVTAEAAAGVDSVRHLVLVSSYLPEIGESLSSISSSDPAPFLNIDVQGGTLGVRPELLADTFLQDCPEVAADAGNRLAQQSLSVVGQPVQSAAWQHVPSTYLVCAQDRGTPAQAQREFARRAGAVVELNTGHHPFLSKPQAVADLLLGLSTQS